LAIIATLRPALSAGAVRAAEAPQHILAVSSPTHWLAQRAGTDSGGLQQMLTIARALMTDPNQVLREEPSTGLASSNVQAMLDILPRPRGRGARAAGGPKPAARTVGHGLALPDMITHARLTAPR